MDLENQTLLLFHEARAQHVSRHFHLTPVRFHNRTHF